MQIFLNKSKIAKFEKILKSGKYLLIEQRLSYMYVAETQPSPYNGEIGEIENGENVSFSRGIFSALTKIHFKILLLQVISCCPKKF